LDEFNCISKEEEKDLCLREQGLTDEEIILKHKLDSGHLKEVYIYIISIFLWISLDLKILPNVRMDIFPIWSGSIYVRGVSLMNQPVRQSFNLM